MKQIPLSNGGFALVDDDDYPFLSQWKWKRHPQGYASRTSWKPHKWITILMHRLINKTGKGFETDHINGDKLDNRKANLRNVTHSQNERNKPLRSDNTSGYKGITWDKARQKWQAKTKHDRKMRNLGRFDTPEEAHAVYEAYVSEHKLEAIVPQCAQYVAECVLEHDAKYQ